MNHFSIPLFLLSAMGTRSRVILRRTTKPHIILWMHWDGYLTGQGNDFCKQLKRLLAEYTVEELQNMLEVMELGPVNDEYQCFKATDLTDFIQGHTTYKIDDCDDIEYEYTIDFEKELFLAKSCSYQMTFVVTFDMIRNGFLVGDLETYLCDDE